MIYFAEFPIHINPQLAGLNVGGQVQCFRVGFSPDAQLEQTYDVLQQLWLIMVDAGHLSSENF
jgi:hypothetical protein